MDEKNSPSNFVQGKISNRFPIMRLFLVPTFRKMRRNFKCDLGVFYLISTRHQVPSGDMKVGKTQKTFNQLVILREAVKEIDGSRGDYSHNCGKWLKPN